MILKLNNYLNLDASDKENRIGLTCHPALNDTLTGGGESGEQERELIAQKALQQEVLRIPV